jgi:hypothetical protein
MSKRFKGPDAKAVVGIKFDSESRDLFIAACQLCAKTGMSLRVVHITQNILSRWIYRDEAYYEQLLGLLLEELGRDTSLDQFVPNQT